MTSFSPRVRLILVCSVLLCLAFLVWGAVLRPLLLAVDGSVEQMHDAQFELHRVRAVLKQRTDVSVELVDSLEREVFSRLLEGDSPTSAVGHLQATVEPLLRESGLQLESMLAEPLSPGAPLTKAGIVLKARGTEAALLKLLVAFENHQTLLVIDRLLIVGQDAVQPAEKAMPAILAVEMRIAGYWSRPQLPKEGPA